MNNWVPEPPASGAGSMPKVNPETSTVGVWRPLLIHTIPHTTTCLFSLPARVLILQRIFVVLWAFSHALGIPQSSFGDPSPAWWGNRMGLRIRLLCRLLTVRWASDPSWASGLCLHHHQPRQTWISSWLMHRWENTDWGSSLPTVRPLFLALPQLLHSFSVSCPFLSLILHIFHELFLSF